MTREEAVALLTEHDQMQVLAHEGKLSDEEKQQLYDQLEMIDWSLPDNVRKGLGAQERGVIEPIPVMELSQIDERREEFEAAGLQAMKEGKVAAVLLAGGQGTRLGSPKPKGMYNIGKTRELFIFECLINNLMETVKKAGAWVPLYIMTSDKNHDDTVAFFEEKNCFGYDPHYIHFFRQSMAPCVDFSGKLLMEDAGRIAVSPNGNGGWYASLCAAGLDWQMKEAGIEWLTAFAVDNVLQRINDPAFVGAVLSTGADCGGMVVRKAAPDERVGVICREDGRPSIVEYYEMTDDMINLRDENGNLLYNFGVILNYMFSLKKLDEIRRMALPLHRAAKKIPYMDEKGRMISPAEPNGFKFETLILDMIHMMDSCCAFEVERNKSFAPVKNLTGIDSVESARKLLEENGIQL